MKDFKKDISNILLLYSDENILKNENTLCNILKLFRIVIYVLCKFSTENMYYRIKNTRNRTFYFTVF